jgi:hypothetical protein
VTSKPPPAPEPTTFSLRATELRALPGGRFEIVIELKPKAKEPQPDLRTVHHQPEAINHAS